MPRLALALSGLTIACAPASARPVAPALASTPSASSASVRPLSPRFAEVPPLPPAFTDPNREKKLAELVPKLEQHVDTFFADEQPPSLAVAMIVDGNVVFARALGQRDKASKEPATKHTLYRIGSISKTFTATALLALRDEGRLSLAEPAERYLPELAQIEYPFRDAQRITLWHLLTHTSGLPRMGDFDATRTDRAVTEAEMLGALERTSLEHAPGQSYVYSNFGVSLLGSVLARRAPERSLRAVIAKRVTEPLGMTETTFEPTSLSGSECATGYAKKGDQTPAPLSRLGASEAAGGLWSSVSDMARWVAFQLDAWPARAETETHILARASLRDAHSPKVVRGLRARRDRGALAAQADAIGFIWQTRENCVYERIVEHGGRIDGFSSSVGFAPERGFGFVVLSSALDTNVDGLQKVLFEKSADALLPREEPAPAASAELFAKFAATFGKCDAGPYTELFSDKLRTEVPLPKYLETCSKLSAKHGSCRLGSVRPSEVPGTGTFELNCERGSIEGAFTVQRDRDTARFLGLRIRSTGFAPPRQLVDAARAALKLHEKWDEARFQSLFASLDLRDKLKSDLEKLHSELGNCRLAFDVETALTSDGERGGLFPLTCDKGAPSELKLTLGKDGKLAEVLFRPRRGPNLRCDFLPSADSDRAQ